MTFINFEQLYRDILVLDRKVPEVDAVFGVPRSGMLPATMFATLRNIPLGIADYNFRVLNHGGRALKERSLNRVLILDDSSNTGEAMETVKKRMKQATFTCLYAAVYVTNPETVDFHAQVTSSQRAFAWNVMNSGLLPKMCVDFDGVLCYDPDETFGDENSERLKYFVENAVPKHHPLYKIGHIVTGRPEFIREETKQWLSRYGYQYGTLDMYDSGTKTQEYNAVHFKARKYLESGAVLFVESNRNEAIGIAKITGKPVLCLDTLELL